MSRASPSPEDDERAARDAMAAGVEAVFQAGSNKRRRAEESLEAQKQGTYTRSHFRST